jgi:GH35 family endo-1,4-beta-xylanase
MKQYSRILLGGAICLAFCASCADNEALGFSVNEPDSLARLEYLKQYDVLKNYVDRTANPQFKLGTGVSVSDFVSKGVVYALTASNFDEMTAGNTMKYGSCVAKDGTMDFSKVTKFIEVAKAASMSVYGHTLAWHSQQNNAYLNGIVTDPNAANYVLHVNTPEAKTNTWDWGMDLALSSALTKGKDYTLKMRIKASQDYSITCWPRVTGGATQYWPTPTVKATTSWTNISSTFTANNPIDVLGFVFGPFKGDFYMDDVSLTDADGKEYVANGKFDENMSGWSKPSYLAYTMERIKDPDQDASAGGYTPQMKADTLKYAMANWIQGMMNACGGYVKAWDVVNEPISGKDINGDGYYDLQSATRGTVLAADAKANFYWQDYMGDLDYVRTAVADARKYFAESGGAASDLKLFINDYNLESDWDNNQKLKSLIHWIGEWEADGKTKIDGIGTQMHVSYQMNADRQASQETHIVDMFKLMAATGKLVRISELDMGIVDANGKTVLTADATDAQLKGQAAFYQFIVKAFFDNVPAAQRYGIAQWAQTDSPSTSSWRANQPIGLWDGGYSRKRAYAGFANGLAGKEVYSAE